MRRKARRRSWMGSQRGCCRPGFSKSASAPAPRRTLERQSASRLQLRRRGFKRLMEGFPQSQALAGSQTLDAALLDFRQTDGKEF